jgi:putative phosphoribosyl transferase
LTERVHLRVRRDRFADRSEAGRSLAALLGDYQQPRYQPGDVLVLGLPRGGVPVAAEVARGIGAELDVLLVRKLGVPSHPELAMGAIAAVADAVEVVTNDTVLARLNIAPAAFDAVYQDELAELRRRSDAYRGGRPALDVTGRVVIVVDDGLATGATMRAAVSALAGRHPHKVVVAVPVGAQDTCRQLADLVDQVVCALTPEPFRAVRDGYRDFSQTTDEQVLAALAGRT